MRILHRLALFALVFTLLCGCAYALTREEMRTAWQNLPDADIDSIFSVAPLVEAPYAEGAVDPSALLRAEAYLNFLRSVAGLEPVTLREEYVSCCQHGAVLTAAWGFVSHDPDRPDGMDDLFYEEAYHAASSSSIVRINWLEEDILLTALDYFVRDDGEQNLPVLGHRRWLLNPMMGKTGFGLASGTDGISYAYMYAHDRTANPDWDWVAWPAAGAFPAELMDKELAWSLVVDPQDYDLAASDISVTLTEKTSGRTYAFPGDGYSSVSFDGYGAGPCIIFRPNVTEEYVQNQIWEVEVSGLSGKTDTISYTVEMASLYPIAPAAVEVSSLEASLSAGETLPLTASVIPAWADDLTVVWESSDPTVASVDATGLVTACSMGICEITCRTVNGKTDVCRVTVG